ncbi:GNAT family N-acetyltransferase [Streptomyces sp. TP-A0874]|uniref:GNAT family N-acetyltransferase n=1 Tax=Streptomyces sp. TP-A0874 TaxID=549819 RepID=UPI0008535254|nr:GNAT family N-acetyltransferase [Streptomyces sp. TP-A0874]
MDYQIRTVGPEDWPALRDLRLAALRDEAAPIAFLDTYENSVAQADSFWRGRATPIEQGGAATTLAAVDAGGTWVGMLALLDETGGEPPAQVHVVSVYVRPEQRGTGLAEALLRRAVDWTWANTGAERIRLCVHEANVRARALYGRVGFTPTGETMVFPPAPNEVEHELALERP